MKVDGILCLQVILLSFLCSVHLSDGSAGDISSEQQICIQKCDARNCTGGFKRKEFLKNQRWYEVAIGWSCLDDCKYNCMWQTVEAFHKSDRSTPQFHGKWPFVRFLGLQEPASVIFSVFNLAAHMKWLNAFRKSVPMKSPMFFVWIGYALVSINAWICSTIFHARDTDVTEKMDYFSAFSIITYSMAAFCIRCLGPWSLLSFLSALTCAGLFFRHIFMMTFVKFDYGYNMQLNVGVGFLNSLCWLTWWFTNRKDKPYAKHGALAIILLMLSMSLELLDFEPIFWTFDSHALWHLSTFPIHAYWYRFVIEDCLYLHDNGFKPGRKLI